MDESLTYEERMRRSGKPVGEPCHWCGREMTYADPLLAPTRDHVIPRSVGGRSKVWACFGCNQLKGNMPLDAWVEVMRQVPEWWLYAEKRGPRGAQLHLAMIECGFEMPPVRHDKSRRGDDRGDDAAGMSVA